MVNKDEYKTPQVSDAQIVAWTLGDNAARNAAGINEH